MQQSARDIQKGEMKTSTAHITKERKQGRKVLLSCMQGTRNLERGKKTSEKKS